MGYSCWQRVCVVRVKLWVLCPAPSRQSGVCLAVKGQGKWRQEDQKYKIILGYTISLRLVWGTRPYVKKEKKKD